MIDRHSTNDMPPEAAVLTRAVRRGVYKAALEHRAEGLPMVVWKDGGVAWVPAQEVLDELLRADISLANAGSQ
jgi:hypothetical protein